MVFNRKTRKDVVGITTLGVGLGALTKVEAVAAPAVPVVTQFAPIAAVAGPVVGAGIVLRSLKQLPLGKTNVLKPIKKQRQFL